MDLIEGKYFYLYLTSHLLFTLDQRWRTKIYLSGVSRCIDIHNIDFIKHKFKFPGVMEALYKQFGILNLFCPFRPNGSYLLRLDRYEERIVAKMLCELTMKEGVNYMTNIKVAGKAVEKMTREFARKPPDQGNLELTFNCPPEKED